MLKPLPTIAYLLVCVLSKESNCNSFIALGGGRWTQLAGCILASHFPVVGLIPGIGESQKLPSNYFFQCNNHYVIRTDPANLDYVIESGGQGDDQPVVDRPDVQARPRRRGRLKGQEGRSSQDQQDRTDSRFLIGLTLCSSIDGKPKACLRPSAKDQGIAQVVVLVFF